MGMSIDMIHEWDVTTNTCIPFFPVQQTTAHDLDIPMKTPSNVNNHWEISSTSPSSRISSPHFIPSSYFSSSTACSAILLNSVTKVLPTSVTSQRSILPQY